MRFEHDGAPSHEKQWIPLRLAVHTHLSTYLLFVGMGTGDRRYGCDFKVMCLCTWEKYKILSKVAVAPPHNMVMANLAIDLACELRSFTSRKWSATTVENMARHLSLPGFFEMCRVKLSLIFAMILIFIRVNTKFDENSKLLKKIISAEIRTKIRRSTARPHACLKKEEEKFVEILLFF